MNLSQEAPDVTDLRVWPILLWAGLLKAGGAQMSSSPVCALGALRSCAVQAAGHTALEQLQ